MGARGNSGVILSQILRGLADTFSDHDEASGADLVAGLRRAPTPRTRPCCGRSRARSSPWCAPRPRRSRPPTKPARVARRVLDHAAAAAREAVERTPELLPVLREAGRGRRRRPGLRADDRRLPRRGRRPPAAGTGGRGDAARGRSPMHGDGAPSLRYEVMYLLEAPDRRSPRSRTPGRRSATPSSSSAGTACGTATCTPTTSAPRSKPASTPADHGAFASPTSSTRSRKSSGSEDGTEPAPGPPPSPTAADRARPPSSQSASAKGCSGLLNSLGVQAVVAGGQSMNPSTAQILEAIERCPADSVIVLPNNKNIVPVAEQVHALTTRRRRGGAHAGGRGGAGGADRVRPRRDRRRPTRPR